MKFPAATQGAFRQVFAVRLSRMVKLRGQSLALIAMMASVINAQCAVSCSLQSIAGSTASHANRLDPDRAGHACCPQHRVPKPKQQQDEAPCPHPPPVSEARLNNSSASFNTMQAVVVDALSNEYRPQLSETYLGRLTIPDCSGLTYLSSIFILRI